MRTSVALMAVVASLGLLSGCGGEPTPYCQAVESGKSTLDSFGAKETDAAFTSYTKVVVAIAAKAPEPIDLQWENLGQATQGVLTAHDDIGFPMQDMSDAKQREGLSASDVEVLNKAYKRFNATTPQRTKVVADVKKTCDITLK